MDNIKDVVHDVIEQLAQKKSGQYQQLYEIWKKNLRSAEAKHSKIIGVKDGVLKIFVDSSACLMQINSKKDTLLKNIQNEIPEIKSIFIKIGNIHD